MDAAFDYVLQRNNCEQEAIEHLVRFVAVNEYDTDAVMQDLSDGIVVSNLYKYCGDRIGGGIMGIQAYGKYCNCVSVI